MWKTCGRLIVEEYESAFDRMEFHGWIMVPMVGKRASSISSKTATAHGYIGAQNGRIQIEKQLGRLLVIAAKLKAIK